MDKIILATRNIGKIKELSDMLSKFNLTVSGLDEFPELEEVEEDGSTFIENALKKARYAARRTGLYAVADDSGLVADALDGAPGVFSARFSDRIEKGILIPGNDETNIIKLLAELSNVPPARRTARFCCAMAAVSPDGREICAEGKWEGLIAEKTAGQNGFGYDPVFLDPETGKHAAELSFEQKNARSHRGKALNTLLKQWPSFWR